MIYISHDSMNPCFWFGLERDLLTRQDLNEDVFLLWRTEPTLMLGRYQNATAEFDESYAQQKRIHVVRRLTGGGTIYTDPGSWQFSYIKKERDTKINFAEFVTPILSALRNLGFNVTMSERNDLLIDGKKFSGNAQYHSNGKVLHHGSILFDTDIDEMVRSLTVDGEKISAKGISSVRQRVTNLKDHCSHIHTSKEFEQALLQQLLTEDVKGIELKDDDLLRIQKEHMSLFESWDWTYGKSPKYEVLKSKRFPGGKVEIRLDLKGGLIENCSISGDFFFAGDIGAITAGLRHCQYDRNSVKARLDQLMPDNLFFQISIDDILDCMF